MTAGNTKKNLLRRLNLLMLLLNHPEGQTKMDIFSKVPEYSSGRPGANEAASRDRTFSRDKEKLSEAGFFLNVDDQGRYYIKPADVFSQVIGFDREQRRVLGLAAAMWQDGPFKVSVQEALLKLGIPQGSSRSATPVTFSYTDNKILTIAEALMAKKPVSFKYQAAAKDSLGEFILEGRALIGRYGQWYLHALDVSQGILKFFRLDRIVGDIRRIEGRQYDIPATYDPQEHAVKIQFPEPEKYCAIAGDEKYLAAVPLAAVPLAEGESRNGYRIFRYRNIEDATTRLVPFLDTVKVLRPQRLQDAVVSRARRSLQFQEQIGADNHLNPKNAVRVRKDRISDILRVLGIAMLNANKTFASYETLLEYLEIDEKQLIADLHTLNYVETPADATVTFGYVDVNEINQERAFMGAARDSLPEALQLTRRQITALIVSLRIFYSYAEASDRIAVDSLIEKFAELAEVDRKNLPIIHACSFSTVVEKEHVGTIMEARRSRKILQFGYMDGTKTSYVQRRAKPLRTYSVGGKWYLQAWCYVRGAERIFRCDRMNEITALAGEPSAATSTTEPVDADLEGYEVGVETKVFERAFVGDSCHDVTVVLRQGDGRFVRDYFAHRIKQHRNHPLVNQVAQVTIKNSDYFARLVVSSGGRIAILNPEEDSQRCRRYAQRIIELYGG